VISETLKNGKRKGIEVGVSPLISEPLIVLLAMTILSSIAKNDYVIGVISLGGACFLIYLGLSNITTNAHQFGNRLAKEKVLLKGIVTNLLNPNAYMFWLTIGGPKILQSLQTNVPTTILLILGFYITFVCSQTTIAVIVDKFRTLVGRKYYLYIIRFLGAILIVFALIFVRNILRSLHIL